LESGDVFDRTMRLVVVLGISDEHLRT